MNVDVQPIQADRLPLAVSPPEARGLARDEVRLMVSGPVGRRHLTFVELARALPTASLLVVNESATVAASLPASGAGGSFLLNLCTRYGEQLWLAEPRRSATTPGGISLSAGERFRVAGFDARAIATYPGLPRLWFVAIEGDVPAAMARAGGPIRYGYLQPPFPPIEAYQTVFARVPGSAEMPSAGRPFSHRVVQDLATRGIDIAPIILHTGVSSLETEHGARPTFYAEPFQVGQATADAVNAARAAGRAVIAVGTTVVRALESAWDGEQVRASTGSSRLFVHPERGMHTVDGLISGFHEPEATHMAMLYAVAGKERIDADYREAAIRGYLWHEFGDSHLILR